MAELGLEDLIKWAQHLPLIICFISQTGSDQPLSILWDLWWAFVWKCFLSFLFSLLLCIQVPK